MSCTWGTMPGPAVRSVHRDPEPAPGAAARSRQITCPIPVASRAVVPASHWTDCGSRYPRQRGGPRHARLAHRRHRPLPARQGAHQRRPGRHGRHRRRVDPHPRGHPHPSHRRSRRAGGRARRARRRQGPRRRRTRPGRHRPGAGRHLHRDRTVSEHRRPGRRPARHPEPRRHGRQRGVRRVHPRPGHRRPHRPRRRRHPRPGDRRREDVRRRRLDRPQHLRPRR
ncbi:hypothetical protein SGPA1_10420 [Streptomyces misionensis JCM 4497]